VRGQFGLNIPITEESGKIVPYHPIANSVSKPVVGIERSEGTTAKELESMRTMPSRDGFDCGRPLTNHTDSSRERLPARLLG